MVDDGRNARPAVQPRSGRRGHYDYWARLQCALKLPIGIHVDGETRARHRSLVVSSEIESREPHRAFDAVMDHALFALYGFTHRHSRKHDLQIPGNPKCEIVDRVSGPPAGIPVAAGCNVVDLVAGIQNHTAVVMDLDFVLASRLERRCGDRQGQYRPAVADQPRTQIVVLQNLRGLSVDAGPGDVHEVRDFHRQGRRGCATGRT